MISKAAEANKRWRAKNPQQQKVYAVRARLKLDADPERRKRYSEQKARRRQEEKRAAFVAYGGAECACCGETELAFLSLDHINNDGNRDQEQHKAGNWYQRLRVLGYPQGLQVLCMNCNFGKRINNGVCPHKGVQ